MKQTAIAELGEFALIKEITKHEFAEYATIGSMKSNNDIRLSLCTVVMNRKEHLLKTLKQNLAIVRKFNGVDINVLDYNSTDGLLSELMKCTWFNEAVREGIIHFYRNDYATKYHRTLPKNTIHLLSCGDYVVNIDADNYVSEPYLEFCLNIIENKRNFFIRPQFNGGDSFGRILCKKSDFEELGGYDLSFEHYGFEDANFVQRLKTLKVEQVLAPAHVCEDNIKHSDKLRIKNEKVKSTTISDRKNRLKELILKPNVGKKNYCETIKIKG